MDRCDFFLMFDPKQPSVDLYPPPQCRLRLGHEGEHKVWGPKGTPLRNVRVSDDVWNEAQARAKAEGTNVSAVVQHALRRYGEGATANVMPPPR